MGLEDFKTKPAVVLVYTGEGKGKTTASLGLLVRALGDRKKVAFIQFIKHWGVSEHVFLRDIQPIYKDQLYFYKGGKGFYNAGELSEKHVTPEQHQKAADETYAEALQAASSGDYDMVICDEVNNAVHEGLVSVTSLRKLITSRAPETSLCLTGRHFPEELLDMVDIATDMHKIKHHFDDGYKANKGVDF